MKQQLQMKTILEKKRINTDLKIWKFEDLKIDTIL